MIDLTPLDVRKKRGDFRKAMRGYLPEEVDSFLDLAALRLEEVVKENLALRELVGRLQIDVEGLSGRERAVQEALVTAQSLREDMREQSRREAELARREAELEAKRLLADAELEAKRLLADAELRIEERHTALEELERKRVRFLRTYRALLERELDVVVVEEGRSPLDDNPVELELSGGRPDEDQGNGARAGEIFLGGLGDLPEMRPEE
jgi:cell division initiation protein